MALGHHDGTRTIGQYPGSHRVFKSAIHRVTVAFKLGTPRVRSQTESQLELEAEGLKVPGPAGPVCALLRRLGTHVPVPVTCHC
eukprot:2034929-Rhodomonas_salina.2